MDVVNGPQTNNSVGIGGTSEFVIPSPSTTLQHFELQIKVVGV